MNRTAPPSKPRSTQAAERNILRKFKSRAHHFIQTPPDDDEVIEWLSIIQDYGGPTRLLDFTESFYIAAFFALEQSTEDACVWAINRAALTGLALANIGIRDGATEQLESERVLRLAESVFAGTADTPDMVLSVLPPRLNERLAIQKGLFLFPTNPDKTFEANLCDCLGFPFTRLDTLVATPLPEHPRDVLLAQFYDIGVVKIILPLQFYPDAFADLYSMNIDAATLFPGLDGFARSLRYVRSMSITIGAPPSDQAGPAQPTDPLSHTRVGEDPSGSIL
jgi:hypothetical protein